MAGMHHTQDVPVLCSARPASVSDGVAHGPLCTCQQPQVPGTFQTSASPPLMAKGPLRCVSPVVALMRSGTLVHACVRAFKTLIMCCHCSTLPASKVSSRWLLYGKQRNSQRVYQEDGGQVSEVAFLNPPHLQLLAAVQDQQLADVPPVDRGPCMSCVLRCILTCVCHAQF